jgi:type 1 glutamine amidotransferase
MKQLARLLLILFGAVTMTASAAAVSTRDTPRILIFSHTTGYRHASIEPAVAALRAMADRNGMVAVASEDPAVFSSEGLEEVDAIVLVSNSSRKDDSATDYFTEPQRAAFQAFVHRGGGVVAIHAAADSHYSWPWYGRMIGARFERHPPGTPSGTIRVVDPRHAATARIPATVTRVDEWYYFEDFNPETQLLVTLDPASIDQQDVNPNPVSWAHEFEGGRIFYTAMGHTPESYAEENFLRHLEGGLHWALRRR